MNEKTYTVTREKHLDHMVRVVPIIFLVYGMHGFLMVRHMGPVGSELSLMTGISLGLMIAMLVLYDTKHKVTLFDGYLEVNFLFFNKKTISFSDISQVEVMGPTESFQTVVFKTDHNKMTLYFVDDAHKIKTWIDSNKASSSSLAA